MPSQTNRRRQTRCSINTGVLVACICALFVVPSRSRADEQSHVRTESTYIQAVLAEATQRSSTVSALIERIQASNVIAHLECGRLKSLTLQGRTLFLVATSGVRYVRVQIDCGLVRPDLMASIGHELQHVAEIANAPDVVDQPSFARLLHRIGFSRSGTPDDEYETEAGLLAKERVSREISTRRSVSTRVASRQD